MMQGPGIEPRTIEVNKNSLNDRQLPTSVSYLENLEVFLVSFLTGQPAKFNVSMRTPKNFPVDLYYLMDISGSMLEDMKRITTLGTRIGKDGYNGLLY